MRVVPITDFIHGAINARAGVPIDIADSTAADLERAGLVRIKAAANQAPAAGKPQDDGAGQPSSSSPAAPASPIKTSSVPAPGAKKGRKKGK